MDPELYRIAADACQAVYKDNTDLGTTEFKVSFTVLGDEFVQVLAIAGTNEPADWLHNFNLFSIKGIKKPAYDAAQEINATIKKVDGYKLLVCGHSKAGPTAIAYKRLFGADYCVAFAPARGLRYWADRRMENTTILIDPDDPVSKAGFLSFGHPVCHIIQAPDDHFGLSVSDHFMKGWVEFVEKIA